MCSWEAWCSNWNEFNNDETEFLASLRNDWFFDKKPKNIEWTVWEGKELVEKIVSLDDKN